MSEADGDQDLVIDLCCESVCQSLQRIAWLAQPVWEDFFFFMMKFIYITKSIPSPQEDDPRRDGGKFNHTQNKCSINELANYKQFFERQFNQPGIAFLKSELKQINGIDFIVMDFITPAVDSRIYNLMFATSLENRLMIGTFNCTTNHLEEWKPLAGEIINSIKVQ